MDAIGASGRLWLRPEAIGETIRRRELHASVLPCGVQGGPIAWNARSLAAGGASARSVKAWEADESVLRSSIT
jgi:hypothetical protein